MLGIKIYIYFLTFTLENTAFLNLQSLVFPKHWYYWCRMLSSRKPGVPCEHTHTHTEPHQWWRIHPECYLWASHIFLSEQKVIPLVVTSILAGIITWDHFIKNKTLKNFHGNEWPLGTPGTGWVEGQPCDDRRVPTKPSWVIIFKEGKKGFVLFVSRHVQVLASLQAHNRRPILFML